MPWPKPLSEHGGLLLEAGPGDRLDALDRSEVIESFTRAGVLLLRGFQPDDAAFHRFGRRFADRLLVDPTPERVSQPVAAEVQTVTLGNDPLNFHYEYGLTPFRPDILWLYCDRPAESGGETIVCDGVEVWGRLGPATRALFAERRLSYALEVAEATWRGFFGIGEEGPAAQDALRSRMDGVPGLEYRIGRNGALSMRYRTSAVGPSKYSEAETFVGNVLPGTYPEFKPYFEDGAPLPEELLQEVEAAARACEVVLAWRPGDVVAIDNTRWMHGRRGFTGGRRVLSLTAYAELRR